MEFETILINKIFSRCIPSGGEEYKQDKVGRRNGKAPNKKMHDVLMDTVKEAKANVNKVVTV